MTAMITCTRPQAARQIPREQAQEHLTTATTMYAEMDMRIWLEKAETEVRPLGIGMAH